jgi:SAM-dependent methyltransferase
VADAVAYGPGIPDERTLRLLGDVSGKRVLVLGSRAPHPFVSLCQDGALVVVVEPVPEHADKARAARDAADVRLELRVGDLADLAFLKADSLDVVLSVGALAEVDDLGRVFRQVHRVMNAQAAFVLSLPHPTATLVGEASGAIVRSAFDPTPIETTVDGVPSIDRNHGIADVFTILHRSKLPVDTMLEPRPSDPQAMLPSTLVVRARKEGS